MGGPGERPCGGLAAPFAIDVAMGVDTKDLFIAPDIVRRSRGSTIFQQI
jgi:hypothetical protein